MNIKTTLLFLLSLLIPTVLALLVLVNYVSPISSSSPLILYYTEILAVFVVMNYLVNPLILVAFTNGLAATSSIGQYKFKTLKILIIGVSLLIGLIGYSGLLGPYLVSMSTSFSFLAREGLVLLPYVISMALISGFLRGRRSRKNQARLGKA
jgi:hypothetical protein